MLLIATSDAAWCHQMLLKAWCHRILLNATSGAVVMHSYNDVHIYTINWTSLVSSSDTVYPHLTYPVLTYSFHILVIEQVYFWLSCHWKWMDFVGWQLCKKVQTSIWTDFFRAKGPKKMAFWLNLLSKLLCFERRYSQILKENLKYHEFFGLKSAKWLWKSPNSEKNGLS